MNKFSFLTMAGILLAIPQLDAQAVMTFSTGLSPLHTPNSNYIFVNRSTPRDEFTFDLAQVKASYFVGVGVKYNVEPFFFAAEAQYNKREYVYDVSYTFPEFGRTETVIQYSEYMNVINIPLSLGVDLGIVDVSSGFLPQLIVSQQSELENISGYDQKLNHLRFGWFTGVAASFNQMRIGINWQMDFNNFVDHAYVHEQSLALKGRPTRVSGTLSYQF